MALHASPTGVRSGIEGTVSRYDDLIAADGGFPAMTGRAWNCADHSSRVRAPAGDTAAWLMGLLDADCPRQVAAGDFLVAGERFAADATDRTVPLALKALGIGALSLPLYKSFAESSEPNKDGIEKTMIPKTQPQLIILVNSGGFTNIEDAARGEEKVNCIKLFLTPHF